MNAKSKDTDKENNRQTDNTAKVPAKVDVTKQGTKKRKCGHKKDDCKEKEKTSTRLLLKKTKLLIRNGKIIKDHDQDLIKGIGYILQELKRLT
ncbi:hypothetical protein Tco_0772933 [Tanacetum coccineum]|uniref:Uncharacterized protein n=1 Tax=Tanacetum coccineum TaxID=301880 RepID=A0ABQ4ZN16_9ASTR